MSEVLFALAALVALVPVSLLGWLRAEPRRDAAFWLLTGVAVAGPAAWAYAQIAGGWTTGLATTLWVTVAASMAVFALTAAAQRHAWRLAPLVGSYMAALALLAAAWQQAPAPPLQDPDAVPGWMALHIAVSVATYGLVTVAAIAALGAFLQERALKAKKPTGLTRRLPSVIDCERLTVRLLLVGEAVLAAGLVTGMAVQRAETGRLLVLDHKTVLVLATFAVIGGLLLAHYLSGVRGRAAARLVLVAYLLLTLGYPGVKFVTDVLLGG